MARDGHPSNVRIEQSSGVPSLDISALQALQRIDTFGPLPADYPDNKISVEYWFDYKPNFGLGGPVKEVLRNVIPPPPSLGGAAPTNSTVRGVEVPSPDLKFGGHTLGEVADVFFLTARVVESKGGNVRIRHSAIVQGLLQVASE